MNRHAERTPPHDLEAEQGVLGSMLLDDRAVDEVGLILRAGNFYDDAHRILFQAMWDIHDQGRRIDVTLLANRLKRDGTFERIGGAAGIARIAQAVPNAAHAQYYARIVRDHALMRQLITASTDNLIDAYEAQGRETTEIVARAEQRVFEVGEMAIVADGEPQETRNILTEAMEQIDARSRGEVSQGLPTGFCELDNLLGGMRPGSMIVIGARPSQGKTALGIQIARSAASSEPVLFFSLEMGALELADRLLSTEAQLPLHRLHNGTLRADQRRHLVQVYGELAHEIGTNLRIEDRPNLTIQQMASICRVHRRRHGLALVVVDYLQLITPEDQRDKRQEQVAKMSRRLKLLARELAVPVIIIAQLNRDAADERPKLQHLRESGAIEQDADAVLLIWQLPAQGETGPDGQQMPPAANEPRDSRVIVAKNRQGPTGDVQMTFLPETTRFVLRDYRHGDEFAQAEPEDEGPHGPQQGEFF